MRRSLLRCSTLSVVVLLACGSDDAGPAPVKPNFTIAYLAETDVQCRIVLSTIDGVLDTLPASTCGNDIAWSRDGKQLAFDVYNGGAYALWTVNADGSGAAAVPGTTGLAYPSWSPDGARLAAVSTTTGVVAVINLDGSGRVDLSATAGTFGRPDWGNGGLVVLYAVHDTIYTASVSTGSALPLVAPSARGVSNPRWSPDGSRIAFVARGVDRFGVYVINTDGTGQRLLIDDNLTSPAAWSPDGRQLTYSQSFGGQSPGNVFIISSDSVSTPVDITKNVSPHSSIAPDWKW